MKHAIAAALTLAVIGSCSLTNPVSSDPTATAASPALTIYNENFAVVRDTVPLTLKVGINHVSYTGMTSQVEPDSVILRDSAGKRTLSILEQNYRGDTVSQGLLLYMNEGKTIDFQVPGVNGGPPTIVQGKIIRSGYHGASASYSPSYYSYNNNYSYSPNQPDNTPLIQVNGELQFGLPGMPLFPALADDSILNPTIEWSIYSDKDGPLDAELAYITEGINWSASYNLIAPENGSSLDFTGWVTIDNESGKEFDNAKIKLMAGDINKVQNNRDNPAAGNFVLSNGAAVRTKATQQALDEYHLYTLPNTTTLRNHETKQVQFEHAPNVPSEEIYTYDGLKPDQYFYNGWDYYNIRSQPSYGTDSNHKVSIERDFDNTAKNGLGVPLPAGNVRFYRRDSDGQIEYIGGNIIDHTPVDETIKLVTGDAFDIVGTRTQTNYTIDTTHATAQESFSIVVKNHKTIPVKVKIVEHLYRSATWTISESSDPFVKIDSSTVNFNVNIPASGSKTVTYTAQYTW